LPRTLTNTTVLSNFAAVGRLDLLRDIFGRLYVTNEVYEEVLDGLEEGYGFYAGIDAQVYPFHESGWMVLVAMAEDEEVQIFRSLPRQLHHGEASCLAIAEYCGWAFLSDDKFAREIARVQGIAVSGTLGVLVRAVKSGLLSAAQGDDLLQQMIRRGYYSPYNSLSPLLENDPALR